MATSTLVPLSEYLRTSYHPDCEWIDGELRERNMGEGPHAILQKFFTVFLGNREEEWGIEVLPEQRVQTSATHFRVPDVCAALLAGPAELIVRTPPLLFIEILSPDDRMSEMREKAQDYLAMGVTAVWVIDPRRRSAFASMSNGSLQPVEDFLTVEGTPVRVPVANVFLRLDKWQKRLPQA